MTKQTKLDPEVTLNYLKLHMEYRDDGLYWRADIVRQGVKRGRRIGSIDKYGYRNVSISKRNVKEHHLVFLWHFGRWPSELDHKDGRPSNNSILNLRECTRQENARNMKSVKRGSSRFKGVSYAARERRWRAYITVDGSQIGLGYHKSEIDAAKAYDESAKARWGEFASLNLPL